MSTNSLQTFRQSVRDFGSDRRGNMVTVLALSLVPLFGLIGAAIDYSRASAARTAMQAALDSTALMLARDPIPPPQGQKTTNDRLTEKAQAYFFAQFVELGGRGKLRMANPVVSASIRNGDTIVVDGSTDLSTDFMFMSKLGGHDAVKILGSSTATWGMTKLRVALALDTTGSMADSGKLEALKDATKKLLDDLSAKAANVKDVQVAIIPFSKDVNVGPGNPQNPNWKPPEWVDWSDWNDNNGSEQSSGSSGSGGWGSGGWGQVSWNNLGQVLNCIRSTGRSGRATQRCIGSTTWVANNHNTWNGCVTDRDQNYDVANTTPDTKTAKGLFPAEQYDGCPVPLLPMGYDFKKMKDHVDTFVAKGNTNATIGLVWAWHALSQDAPLNSPPITDSATRQIIILLTDGLNTENRFSDLQQDVDARMKLACNNIKAAKPGIEVYTILVNTEAVKLSSSLLQECSTTPKKPDEKFHFVVRKSTEIQDVFKQISTQMTALRLAQ